MSTKVNPLLPLLIALAVVLGLVQLDGFTVYASSFNDFSLSADGGVKASYDESTKLLSITGAGTIEHAKWKAMAQKIHPNYYCTTSSGQSESWRYDVVEDDMEINFSGASKAIKLYGSQGGWGMFEWFSGQIHFNGAVDLAPTATDLSQMFREARQFNEPLDWDTSAVTDMSYMFKDAKSFNQPLDWDTSSVTDMTKMFYYARSFNRPLDWDTSNVTDMSYMFEGARDFNQPVCFDIAKLQKAKSMFDNSEVESVVFDNVDGNQDVAADAIFNGCDNLSFIEFSGLKDVTIDAFSGDYFVEENSGTPIAKQADQGYVFTDNLHYKVYLQVSSFDLTDYGDVVASYDVAAKKLTISGHGRIDRDKWKAMAQTFDADNYNNDFEGWVRTEDFDIYFSDDASGKIELPVNSVALFDQFDGDIDFNDAVDTSAVTNMRWMFYHTTGLNQSLTLDINSASSIEQMFVGSTIKRLVLNNGSSNQDVGANLVFHNCANLEYLEFSGLATASIDGFSGDYYVEADGASPIAKQADEGYTFTDNLHYKVYLQPVVLAAPTISLSKAGSAIKVSWPAVADATGYQVFRADALNGPYTLFKTTTGLSYTNSGALVRGMPYFYKVRAYKNDGGSYTFSDFSTVKGIYAPGALAKPAAPSLTLDENAGGIRLNWNAQPRITGYQIFRGVSTDKPFSYLKTTSGLAQVYTNLSGLNSGRPYYYKIRAYRTADGVTKYGDFSTIKGLFAGTNEPALNAVNFNLSNNAAVSVPNVRVTWSGVSGADGYCVYRWDGVHKNWIGLKATGPNARVYTNINGVVSGKTFFYGMRPLHISGGTTYYGNIGQAKGYKVE